MSAPYPAIRSATATVAMVGIAVTAAFGSAAAQTPSTQPGEAVDAVATEAPVCQRLTDFNEDDSAGWFIVNDGVMGGRSQGGGFIEESVLRFEGTVVTAGGGFTSARRQLDGGELAGSTRIDMRVRPDALASRKPRNFLALFSSGRRRWRRPRGSRRAPPAPSRHHSARRPPAASSPRPR